MRFIVALLALLASTAAMAEPQRQTQRCERTHPRSLVDRQPWQHHVLRFVRSQYRAVNHQRQHDNHL